ncbi:3D domain-containing protein [Clostridium sp. 'deep sea']|uniref:3D domain-containing protein n=1 Tax=Clostridium sp. 'deep sea' TaxID=2779445 RepID=UPI00189663CF|nr:3D domain-containing protein [Clostridium sp. 'deep sea']QOR36533.1 3D domain-containing protein [Clostridium sp. 'deep sea']
MTIKILLYSFCVVLIISLFLIITINPTYSTELPLLSIVRVIEGDLENRVLTLTSKTRISDVAQDNEAGIFIYKQIAGTESYIANSLGITGDLDLSVLNQQFSYSTTTTELPYTTKRVYDYDNLTWGEAKTTKGVKGLSIELWENDPYNNKQLVLEKVVVEPVDNITKIGRKKIYINIDKSKYTKMNVEATAYIDNQTATGIKPYKGVIAVDPKVIPLYSKVYIPGYGMATALDTGGAIKGNKIDLFFEDKKEVYLFGRRNLTIYVLK